MHPTGMKDTRILLAALPWGGNNG